MDLPTIFALFACWYLFLVVVLSPEWRSFMHICLCVVGLLAAFMWLANTILPSDQDMYVSAIEQLKTFRR